MSYFRISPDGPNPSDALEDLVVVVPTIRKEQLATFCRNWVHPSIPVRFVFVHDAPELLDVPDGSDPGMVRHVCWKDIDSHLQEDSWIIPRRSDCVRSYGFLVAQAIGAKYICSMDDDCEPMAAGEDAVRTFWESHLGPICRGMVPTFSTTGNRDRMRPRGMPLPDEERLAFDRSLPVVINHGLWNGVIDRSGRDEVEMTAGGKVAAPFEDLDSDTIVVPRGFFYPMCGMNVCFEAGMLPCMYFGLQGHLLDPVDRELRKLPYDRYGDIWAGMVSKLVADALGLHVTSGPPNVKHMRASNCLVNADKEARGILLHPKLLRDVFQNVTAKRQSSLWCTGFGQVADVVTDVVGILSGSPGGLHRDDYDASELGYLEMWSEALATWVELSVR